MRKCYIRKRRILLNKGLAHIQRVERIEIAREEKIMQQGTTNE